MGRRPIKKKKTREMVGEEMIRTRLPHGKEVFGIVEQLLGFCKMRVRCSDEKLRICRVPGHLRRRMWIKRGDFILVEPWDVQSDIRGNILYKYTRTQVGWLKNKGLLKGFEEEF